MKSKALFDKAYIFLFLGLIFIPGILFLSNQMSADDKKETAFLNDTITYKNFPNAFNHYFDHSFGFRKSFIKAYYYLRLHLFKETYIDDKVIVGKNGWLFYGPENDGYGISDYLGKASLTDAELKIIAENLSQQEQWLSSKNIQFITVVCPNKQSIYPEYLPASLVQGKSTILDQLVPYITQHTNVKIIDLRQVLLDRKNKINKPLYYKNDTHWNELGAYLGFTALYNEIYPKEQSLPSIENCKIKISKNSKKDIAEMLELDLQTDEGLSVISPLSQSPCQHKLKVLIFHDSFFWGMKPFFETHFDSVAFRPHFWNSFDWQFINETKPDIVIYQMVERYTGTLLRKNPPEIQNKN